MEMLKSRPNYIVKVQQKLLPQEILQQKEDRNNMMMSYYLGKSKISKDAEFAKTTLPFV
jgi:hypothetical protein